MKKLILLTTLVIVVLSVRGQTSRFPIKPGSSWRINYEYSYNCSNSDVIRENGDEEYEYFIDGDTTISSRDYFKLYKSGVLFLDTPFRIEHKYMGAIRDSADRFYFVPESEGSENLLYDFTVGIGDSIFVEDPGIMYPVDNIDTLENGRKKYELYILNVHCGSANTIIEGIGWLGGILEGNSCSGHPGVRGSYLVCYSEDDQPVYETDRSRCGKPLSCSDEITGVDHTPQPFLPKITVLPGGQLKVSLAEDQNGTFEITIYDTAGKIVVQTRSELSELIDISNLRRGIFVIRAVRDNNFLSAKFILE